MKKYFISKGKGKEGPYSLESIKNMELTDEYSIWEPSFENWKNISEMEDLKDFIIPSPPISPSEKKAKEKSEIRKKAIKVSLIVFFLLVPLCMLIGGFFKGNYELRNAYPDIYGGAGVIRKSILQISILISLVISSIVFFSKNKPKIK